MPLIKNNDELIFDSTRMTNEDLEWKYLTSKKTRFAIFPAVNFNHKDDRGVRYDYVECIVFYPADKYDEQVKAGNLKPNMDGNVSIHVDEDWYVVSNGKSGKGSRVGAVHPSASEHMYLGRFFYRNKKVFEDMVNKSPEWEKFMKTEISKCRIGNQVGDEDSSFVE